MIKNVDYYYTIHNKKQFENKKFFISNQRQIIMKKLVYVKLSKYYRVIETSNCQIQFCMK